MESSKIILVMGLSGSGKTSLARPLATRLQGDYFNADKVRHEFGDWDFSKEGRERQAERMKKLAKDSPSKYVVLDFICPLPEYRSIVGADYTIWMNTRSTSKYVDTDALFIPPSGPHREIKGTSNLNKEYTLIRSKLC